MPSHVWQPIGATVRGAAHVRRGLPNEDAFCVSGPGPIAGMAVADGHGDRRVPRAARGARFAAEFGVHALTRALGSRPGDTAERDLDLPSMADELVSSWQQRVLRDCLGRPPSDDELAEAQLEHWDRDDVERILGLYGTTLLAAAADEHSLLVCQIGDGDLAIVHGDGSLEVPLAPPDSVGQFTASLAMVGARDHLRIAVVDLAQADDALVWACTDGFSGAQADAGWRALVAEQLSTHRRTHGSGDVAARLPGWLRPAAETAGDDTTMTILVRAVMVDAEVGAEAEVHAEVGVDAEVDAGVDAGVDAHAERPGADPGQPVAGATTVPSGQAPASLVAEAETVPARRRRLPWRKR